MRIDLIELVNELATELEVFDSSLTLTSEHLVIRIKHMPSGGEINHHFSLSQLDQMILHPFDVVTNEIENMKYKLLNSVKDKANEE